MRRVTGEIVVNAFFGNDLKVYNNATNLSED
jgi:hypothetical protein